MNAYEHYCLGNECLNKCEYSKAIQHFLISSQEDPHYKTYEKMYQCYCCLNETDNAFKSISKAYQMNKKNDKTALEYANMLVSYRQDYVLAKDILKNILQRNSSYNPAKIILNNIEEIIKNQ